MGMNEKNKRAYEVIVAVMTIPKHIIKLHGTDNVTEFLLHNLGQQDCFNFSKAAYFIDNPDFDHLKGIAGFSKDESYLAKVNHWTETQEFSEHMKKAAFNSMVRDTCRCSIKRNKMQEEKVVQEISDELHFLNPRYVVWPIKHDNHGLLVFEKTEEDGIDEHLENALQLFGFCPVF